MRRALLALTVATVLATATGCGITFGPQSDSTATIVKHQNSIVKNGLHLDLRHPPTRLQVGLLPGKQVATLKNGKNRKFNLSLILPNGKPLTLTARQLIVESPTPTANPNRVMIRRMGFTYGKLKTDLDTEVSALGISKTQLDQVLRQLRTAPVGSKAMPIVGSVSTRFTTPVTIELRPKNGQKGLFRVDYVVIWN